MDHLIDNMQKQVTGTVRVRLHKGNLRILGRKSPFSLYQEQAVSFEDKETDQKEIVGMIKNYGVQAACFRACVEKAELLFFYFEKNLILDSCYPSDNY